MELKRAKKRKEKSFESFCLARLRFENCVDENEQMHLMKLFSPFSQNVSVQHT